MKSIVGHPPQNARSRRESPARPVLKGASRAGPLAGILFLYIVVVVGRAGDIVPGLAALPLAKIVAALALITAVRERPALARTPIWSLAPIRFTLLILLLTTVSIFFSVYKSETLGVITGTVLSVGVSLILMIKAARNWAAVRMLLLGCVFAVIVLLIAAWSTNYAGRAGSTRSLDPNDFAFVLVGLIPIVIAFTYISSGLKRACFAVIAFFVVVTILLTQSRGGLLGLCSVAVALVIVLPAMGRRGQCTLPPSTRTRSIRALMVALVALGAWMSIPQGARTRLATITSIGSDYNLNLQDSTGRLAIWTETLPLALRRPWGWGAGTFPTVDGVFAGGRYKAPHNTFLQALIELGVVGLILEVATIVSSFGCLSREFSYRTGNSDQESLERRVFARGIVASLIGFCVSGFFLSELYSEAFWIVIILAALIGHRTV